MKIDLDSKSQVHEIRKHSTETIFWYVSFEPYYIVYIVYI